MAIYHFPGLKMKVYVHYDQGDAELHTTLKFTLPKKWATDSPLRILQLFVESYNKKHEGKASLDVDEWHLENEDGIPLASSDVIQDVCKDRGDLHLQPGKTSEGNGAKASAPEVTPTKPANDGRLRCKNFGCQEYFSPEDNGWVENEFRKCNRPFYSWYSPSSLRSDSACKHHTGPPIFHDTKKGWSCCAKRVYDWDEFQAIEGCAVGAHNATAAAVTFAESPTVAVAAAAEQSSGAGSQVKSIADYNKANPNAATAASSAAQSLAQKPKCTRKEDGTASCINKGCQKDFIVAENTPRSCQYHKYVLDTGYIAHVPAHRLPSPHVLRSPPVFHDTGKFWGCCPDKVKYSFEDFMEITGCCKGYHNDGSGEFGY